MAAILSTILFVTALVSAAPVAPDTDVAAVPWSRRTRHVGRLDAADVVVYGVEDRCLETRAWKTNPATFTE
jgi:hypothetical protein